MVSPVQFVRGLELADLDPWPAGDGIKGRDIGPITLPVDPKAAVDVGSIVAFTDGVDATEKEDVLYAVQLAQRAASKKFDRFDQTPDWYRVYTDVLENVGWATQQFNLQKQAQDRGDFHMDEAALKVITAVATQNYLGVLETALGALSKMADEHGTITLFDFQALAQQSGNFQLGSVVKSANGALTMALGAFFFRNVDKRTKFLFFRWGENEVEFWAAAQVMTLNGDTYDRVRGEIRDKMRETAAHYVAAIDF
jgi:hypothetical protein